VPSVEIAPLEGVTSTLGGSDASARPVSSWFASDKPTRLSTSSVDQRSHHDHELLPDAICVIVAP